MIVFSHGFGVRKDDRGLFSDIAPHLKDEFVMFDYNSWDDDKKMLSVSPLDQQIKMLRSQVDKISEPYDLICHSQGCLVAALALPKGARRTIFLAPATTTTSDRFAKLFTNRPESVYNRSGQSQLHRSDGSITSVPKEFWDSLDEVGDATAHYGDLAGMTELHIVTSGADEVLGKTDFSSISQSATLHHIASADHNFTKDSRQLVINKVLEILG